MKILYQPTLDDPQDWKSCESKDWSHLGEFTVHALNIQGDVWLGYDYYGMRDNPDGSLDVTAWCDSEDWKKGVRWARTRRYTLIGPDPRSEYGGAYNSYSPTIIYADKASQFSSYRDDSLYTIKKYKDFDSRGWSPRNGIWVKDKHHEDLNTVMSVKNWREWTEGVPPEEIVDGRIPCQRSLGRYVKPDGTITFYHTTTARSVSGETAEYENALSTVIGSTDTQTVSNITSGELGWAAVTLETAPAEVQWPTTGVYRCQLDVSSISSNCEIGLLTLDGEAGHFTRNATQHFEQSQSSVTTTGLHIVSITDPSWSSGSNNNLFSIAIACNRVTGHSKETVTLQLGEADDFVDGPWPTPSGYPVMSVIPY